MSSFKAFYVFVFLLIFGLEAFSQAAFKSKNYCEASSASSEELDQLTEQYSKLNDKYRELENKLAEKKLEVHSYAKVIGDYEANATNAIKKEFTQKSGDTVRVGVTNRSVIRCTPKQPNLFPWSVKQEVVYNRVHDFKQEMPEDHNKLSLNIIKESSYLSFVGYLGSEGEAEDYDYEIMSHDIEPSHLTPLGEHEEECKAIRLDPKIKNLPTRCLEVEEPLLPKRAFQPFLALKGDKKDNEDMLVVTYGVGNTTDKRYVGLVQFDRSYPDFKPNQFDSFVTDEVINVLSKNESDLSEKDKLELQGQKVIAGEFMKYIKDTFPELDLEDESGLELHEKLLALTEPEKENIWNLYTISHAHLLGADIRLSRYAKAAIHSFDGTIRFAINPKVVKFHTQPPFQRVVAEYPRLEQFWNSKWFLEYVQRQYAFDVQFRMFIDASFTEHDDLTEKTQKHISTPAAERTDKENAQHVRDKKRLKYLKANYLPLMELRDHAKVFNPAIFKQYFPTETITSELMSVGFNKWNEVIDGLNPVPYFLSNAFVDYRTKPTNVRKIKNAGNSFEQSLLPDGNQRSDYGEAFGFNFEMDCLEYVYGY